uniref:trafficking protein particle complex subunit 12-like n=1 Tax=Styela clava TaxID=7725 RepID=UPI00193938DA|nr:trafficking protein particle complex subunit 12-like [Styela clava]
MADGGGDVQNNQLPNEPIPVCTLFSDGSIDTTLSQKELKKDFSDVSNSQNVVQVKENESKEPELCDVFGSGNSIPTLSGDDIFSKISEDAKADEAAHDHSFTSESIDDSSISTPMTESIKLTPSMETLRLNRSVDSFIVEELIESDEIPENSGKMAQDVLLNESQPVPSAGIPSFSISPDDMVNTESAISDLPNDIEVDDIIEDTSMEIEKLSLEDPNVKQLSENEDTSIQESKMTYEESKSTEINETEEVSTQQTNTEPEIQPEIPTTGLLFTSVQDKQQTLFPSPVSERHGIEIEEDDPFAAALSNSVLDRRRDAWLPCEDTRAILTAAIVNHKSPDLEMEKITRPGLSTSELLEDPVKELVVRMTGSENVVKRGNLTMDDVTLNKDGIKKLMESGNLRSAANLCAKLLTTHGQGFGQVTRMTLNTSETLQLWYTRIYILTKLKLYDMATSEISTFKNLDNADLYYEFYPDVYPGRRGSMVSFSFRLLHAEFPRHVDRAQLSLARLHRILNVCDKILQNLNDGKTEVGEMTVLNSNDVEASIKLWNERKVRTLFSIGNTLMQLKDYTLAVEVYDRILKMHPESAVALQSGIGRVYLHLGDIRAAQLRFTEAEKAGGNEAEHKVQLTLNRGFMYIGTNNWKEAVTQFESVLALQPHNIIALNNKAVCMLYLGKLKDAIAILESGANEQTTPDIFNKVTNIDWQQIMLQGLISNLSTLYELESSRYVLKKRGIFLKQIAPTCSDSFNTACFKEI